eukprot:TRINITY_DN526_c0_g1_i4.p1 TRINITY_DN526_c0_g1~~TRINITY_DN526_c0_g1_i4.p1  ORF type:complete len:204 (-),score=37.52 TRINITY_DN526_c0_g1_i4:101-628(-)
MDKGVCRLSMKPKQSCGSSTGPHLACTFKLLVVWLACGVAGWLLSYAAVGASMMLFPGHKEYYHDNEGTMFRPHDHPAWLFAPLQPFYMAMLILLSQRFLFGCPPKIALTWALVSLPGTLMNAWINVPLSMVACWFISGVVVCFGQAFSAIFAHRLLFGCKPCLHACSKCDQKTN